MTFPRLLRELGPQPSLGLEFRDFSAGFLQYACLDVLSSAQSHQSHTEAHVPRESEGLAAERRWEEIRI